MDENWAFVLLAPVTAGCILTVVLLLFYSPIPAIITLAFTLLILKITPRVDRKYEILGFLNTIAFTIICIMFMLRVHLPPDLAPELFYLIPLALGSIYCITIVFPIWLIDVLRELIIGNSNDED